MKASEAKSTVTSSDLNDAEVCGLIMPISATATHDEKQWADIRTLLTRAIKAAGMEAIPVWKDTSNERVSERIIGNIFRFPIVIAATTDLNANVMFELGMRLASKKPTIVIMARDGEVPFDIRDYHLQMYPADLNILEMETFLKNIEGDLVQMMDAYKRGAYQPFLKTVVIDVISPDEREVPLNSAVLEQLRELSETVKRLDRPQPSLLPTDRVPQLRSKLNTAFQASTHRETLYASIPKVHIGMFVFEVKESMPDLLLKELGHTESSTFYSASLKDRSPAGRSAATTLWTSIVTAHDGRTSIPATLLAGERPS